MHNNNSDTEDHPSSSAHFPPIESDTLPPANNSSAYLSNQLRTLYHLQQFLSHQLQQARQDTDNEDASFDHELEEVTVVNDRHQSSSIANNANETYDNGSNDRRVDNNTNNNREIFLDENSLTSGSTRIDLQLFTRWLEQSIPFIVLLSVLWIYQHRTGILIFLCNSAVFMQVNQSLKKQVSLKDKRKVNVLVAVILGLIGYICLTYAYLRAEEPWRYLILLPPKELLTVWNAFWIIMINDFFVRFFTMLIKACIIIVVGHKPPHKRKAQLYTVVEMTSNTYRSLLPIPIWFHYFYLAEDGDTGSGHVFSVLMAGLYLAFKVTTILEKSKQYFAFVRAYIAREVPYGRYAAPEQVTEEGNTCSICQEKMVSPIILSCSHIFCEDCVSEWFERERTCPLCRASIMAAGNRSHSDGTTSVLAQVF